MNKEIASLRDMMRRPGIVGLGVGVLFFVLSATWAWAGPLFSIPDENAHVTKALALSDGQWSAWYDDGVALVTLPEGYEYNPSLVCFVFNDTVSASCAGTMSDPGSETFPNWVANYNPLYYGLVSVPVYFLEGNTALYAMRIVSALASAVLVGLAASIAARHRHRPWLLLAMVSIAAPVTTYFAGSVNPQGMEITSALLAIISLLALLDSPRTAPSWWWVAHVVGAAILINVRASGLAWYAAVVVVALITTGFKKFFAMLSLKPAWFVLAAVGAAGGFAFWWLQHVGQLTQEATPGTAPLIGASFGEAAVAMISTTPFHIQQAIGVFGWLDTYVPAAFIGVAVVALTLPVILLFLHAGRPQVVRTLALLALGALLPVVVQGWAAANTGIIWQGRYAIFIYVSIGMAVAWMISESQSTPAGLPRRAALTSALLLAGYSSFVFVFVLSRYVTGLDEPLFDILTAPEWTPPGGVFAPKARQVAAQVAWIVWMVKATGHSHNVEIGDRVSDQAVEAA